MATTSDSTLAAPPPDAQAAELHFLRKRNAELQSQVEKLILDSASNNVGAGAAPSCSTSLDGGVIDVRGKRSDEFLDQPSDFVRNLSLDGHSELGLHHRRTKSSNNSKKRSWSFSPNKLRGRRNNIESGLSEGFDNECNNTNATSPARKTIDRGSDGGAASLKRYKPPRLNPLSIEQGDGEFIGIKPANDASSEESDHLINDDDDDSYNKHMQSDLGSQSSISAAFPPFKDQIKERAGWLIGLLFLQSCSSFIIQYNEQFLQNNMVLVQFLTMLVGAGGNAGNQAAVRVIRSLAVGTLNRRTMRFFLMQEAKMAVGVSFLIGLTGFIRASIFRVPWGETIAITTSVVVIVATSIAIGSTLPLAMKRVGIDPAHSSTTIQVIMDILGVLITVCVSSFVLSFKIFQSDDNSDY